MIGTLQDANGRPEIRFVRNLAHSPDKVWRAITEPEHLQAWFPDGIEADWSVGATLKFAPNSDAPFSGEVLVFDPPRVLEFTWGTDVLRFELTPSGDGTALAFTDTIDELGKAARDGAGWHECLDHLVTDLDGRNQEQWGKTWERVHPDYVEAFGPEAATIGPPS